MVTTQMIVENIIKIIPEFEFQFGRPMKLLTKNLLTNYQSKVLTIFQSVPIITMSELADRLVMSKPQLTANVDVLVKLGFVKRIYDESDRRKIMVTMTPEGKAYLENTKSRMADFYNLYFDAMSEEEMDSLYTAMETLLAHLSKLNPLVPPVEALGPLGAKGDK